MKFKLGLILIILLLTSNISRADYSRLKLYQVIEMTDLAAVGVIVKVDIECYTILIEKLLYGNYSEKTISIVKFANWQDHYRFKKYEVGQREIIFTKKSNYFGDPFEYVSIGAGNEGEIEIIGDSVLVLDRISRVTKYKFNDFCNAIVDYHNNLDKINGFYTKELEKYYEPFDDKILDSAKFSNDYISELEKKSVVHTLLISDKRNRFISSVKYDGKYGCKELKYESDIFRELFKNYENRIKINVLGYNIDSVDILSSECITIKKSNDFFVKPIKGKKTNLYFVYKYNSKIDTIWSFDFYIEKYRPATVNIDIFKTLKESKEYPWGHLSVSYGKYGDWSQFFDIVSFSLDIISKNNTTTLNSVSSRITYEMMQKIRESKKNDNFIIYNIKAINDKGECINIKPIKFQINE